jgi:hypothetical protein
MAMLMRKQLGLGQSPCPSLKQLQGIVDPTDPCQNGTAAGSDSITSDMQAGLDYLNSLLTGSSSSNPLSGTTGVYIALGALFLIILATGGRR